MRKMLVRAALLSGAVIALNPASASHSWGNYHWARTSNPLKLTIERQIDATKWGSAYSGAVSDWNQSTVLDLTGNSNNYGTDPKKCTAITGKVLVCNAAYGRRGWLGIASIWASGSHITKATTKLNDSYHDSSPYNTPAWRNFVTCQEIGHDFGLDHQDENFNNANLGTCMDYTNDPSSNQHPNNHDMQQLQTIYGHTDSTDTSVTQQTNFGLREPGRAPVSPPGQNEASGDGPAQWGRAIHHDAKGRPDVFVKALGGDRRMITHVLWAPDAKGTEAH